MDYIRDPNKSTRALPGLLLIHNFLLRFVFFLFRYLFSFIIFVTSFLRFFVCFIYLFSFLPVLEASKRHAVAFLLSFQSNFAGSQPRARRLPRGRFSQLSLCLRRPSVEPHQSLPALMPRRSLHHCTYQIKAHLELSPGGRQWPIG